MPNLALTVLFVPVSPQRARLRAGKMEQSRTDRLWEVHTPDPKPKHLNHVPETCTRNLYPKPEIHNPIQVGITLEAVLRRKAAPRTKAGTAKSAGGGSR